MFRLNREDELRRVLCAKVSESLRLPSHVKLPAVRRIVDDVIGTHELGVGMEVKWGIHEELFRLGTNARSRSLCADCETVRCCFYKIIQLSVSDIERLSNYLNLSAAEFIKRHCKRIVLPNRGLVSVLKNTEPCEFLEKGKCCSIYEARPVACKEWPVIIDDEAANSTRICIHYFCNYLFNLLRYEITLRALNEVTQANAP